MTYLQSKPILQPSPMSTTTVSKNPSPNSTISSEISEDFFTKEIHSTIVQTTKVIQSGAKTINVTFGALEKHLFSKQWGHLGKRFIFIECKCKSI